MGSQLSKEKFGDIYEKNDIGDNGVLQEED